jgi:hypothetical protein
MPGDLTAYRLGLAVNLAAGLSTPGLTISPYVLANPQPPVIWVRPVMDVLVDYHQAMRNGVENWHLVIQAYSGAYHDVEAQQLLDAWISSGASSLKTAVESDRTLGGTCQDLKVSECRSYGEFLRPDGSSLAAAEWAVEITA